MGGVFVNYRTGDGDWAADRLAKELQTRFGEQNVFLDSRSIRAGENYADRILNRLHDSDVLLVIIGANWLTAMNEHRHKIDWVYREIAEALGSGLTVIPLLLEGAVRLTTKDLPGDISSLARCQDRRLHRATSDRDIADLLDGLAAHLGKPPCPYRGLKPFGVEDAPYFYGRDVESRKLAERVAQQSVVLVVGASGSGKSSLIHAGLRPRMPEKVRWAPFQLVPERTPRELLCSALTAEFGSSWDAEDLSRLAAAIATAGELVLCVDQFEELVATDPAAARELFNLVVALVRAAPVRPRKGPALRAVFTARPADLDQVLTPEYARLPDESIFTVSPMKREENLTAAVIEPAAKVGRPFEAGLVERIVQNAFRQPAQLPLVEFALTRLWEKTPPGVLTHESYENLGGVAGALTTHADDVFADFEENGDGDRVRRLLIQLVRPSDDGFVLSPVRLEQLDEPMQSLARKLAKKRLVVIRHGGNHPEVVALAHAALVHAWQRLRGWLDSANQFRVWQEQLRVTLNQWEDSGYDPGSLLRGAPLAVAEEWLKRTPTTSSPTSNGITSPQAPSRPAAAPAGCVGSSLASPSCSLWP